ncbi:MAG TPA: acyl-CoA dehydrogenase family protein [Gemmatimonadaceae bacterium]|nr:acyl-CoA dehydrogenase family protein [Gemmatimonadaceae bacterium]
MDFTFTPEQEALKRTIVRFARERLNDDLVARDREQRFSRERWRACGELGLPGLPVPESLGGAGLDPLTTAIALEAFGYGCADNGLVFSVAAHLLSCVVPLWKFGAPEQQARWLPGLCDGTWIGVHAMTEPESGSDSFAMRTRAVKDGDGWRITGTKTFISNGPEADVVIVFALTDPARGFHGGVTGFLVEKGTPGFTASRKIEKMGLRTSPFGALSFDEVWVPDAAVVGQVGGGSAIFIHAMDWERICLFAAHVGQMERLLERGVQYARTRQQFGKAIGKFQGVAHKLADFKVRLECARLLTYRAASKLEKTRGVAFDAAMTKLFVSESLVQGALDVLQVFAGYGYATDYEIEREVRDALGSRIYSGTSDMQRNTIAAWMGL